VYKKKYNFETGFHRTPVENKKRDLVTRDGNGNDGSSGNKNIKTDLKKVKKTFTVRLVSVCLATVWLHVHTSYATLIVDLFDIQYIINETTLKRV